MTTKNLVEAITVTSPCTEDWGEMRGNAKVRFCSHCESSVNNLSEMTRKEAMRLVQKSDGRICVRYIKNPRTNAPVFADKFYQISRRAGLAAGVLGATLAVSNVSYAQGSVNVSKKSDQETLITETSRAKEEKKVSPTASVSGYVTDSAGAVIPNATVSITGNGINQTVSANENGSYLFSNVPSGEYDLSISASAFTPKQINITTNDGTETVANASLDVGEEFLTMGMMVAVEFEQPLLQAVAEGNLEEVTTLIANGANVNAKDKNYSGITALFLAVERGNLEIVEALLNYGAKVNIRDDQKRTPLMALEYGTTPEIVRLLLRYNAKVTAVDKEGNNALHIAAQNNEPEIIQLLINEGADLNAQNKEGQTPLMIAAYYDAFDTVQALLNAGAKVNIRDEEGETALTISRGEESENAAKIVELLIQYGARE
jgi:hypothetical protein